MAKKKTSRRKQTTKSVGTRRPSTRSLSTEELYLELARRQDALLDREAQLLAELDEVQHELQFAGHAITAPAKSGGKRGTTKATRKKTTATGSTRRTRPRNERPLKDVLYDLIVKQPMPTREAAEKALNTGYKTKSKNFSNNVAVVLHNDKRFKLRDGVWSTTR